MGRWSGDGVLCVRGSHGEIDERQSNWRTDRNVPNHNSTEQGGSAGKRRKCDGCIEKRLLPAELEVSVSACAADIKTVANHETTICPS